MFSVEIMCSDDSARTPNAVEIYIDRKQIDDLIHDLSALKNLNDWESVRLFSELWGGEPLSEQVLRKGNHQAHMLRIFVAPAQS